LNEQGLAAFRQQQAQYRDRSDRQILVEGGMVTEEQYLRALQIKHGIPFVEPETALVDDRLLSKTTIKYLLRHRVLPIRAVDGAVDVVAADPLNYVMIQDLERLFGAPIHVTSSTSEKITEALRTLERVKNKENGATKTTMAIQYREIEDISEAEDPGEEAVQLVDYLICRAIELGASDLHIEPKAKRLAVRVRVDGVLQPLTELPTDLTPRIVSRVKILCNANIAERRLHQDGRIFVRVEGREVDIRVSTYASMFGETLVLRILDRFKGLMPLDALGFEAKVLTTLRELVLRTSSGLMLVTGPTGSGKTTTLYSFVDYIMSPTLKVISCEDPVEYVLDGAVQCSVNEKTGPTFADSLRAILRQDPDIIVVGEVRDQKTAYLAVEAALTGHKVFSTFHTEDAVAAVVRLLEMGIEPFLVSSTLGCVVAQRLVRKLCEQCRRPGELAKKDLRFLGLSHEDLSEAKIMTASGCPHCGDTGYKGRIGIHEVLLPDDDFRDAIMQRASSKELRALAKRLPIYLTLQEDGLLKTATGSTTATEIADSVPRDPHPRSLNTLREIAATRSFIEL